MLKFLRKSRKTMYFVSFLILCIWFVLYDFITEKELNIFFNIIRSIVFVLVIAFFQLVTNSKDSNEQ